MNVPRLLSLTSLMCMTLLAGNDAPKSEKWSVRTESMNRPPTFKVTPDMPHALDKARKMVATASRTGDIMVEFAEGTYYFEKEVLFTAKDSGSSQARVIYRAAPGARVIFDGGVPIKDLKPLADPALLALLPQESRGKVMMADLRAQGITDMPPLRVKGFGFRGGLPEQELFYDQKPLTLSRWPKEGFVGALDGPQGKQVTHVRLDLKGRAQRWRQEKDPWLFAYWHFDWAEIYEPIRKFGPQQDEIIRDPAIKLPYGVTPIRTRAYVLNLFSELSQPGDYYLDRQEGKLYVILPYEGGQLILSQAPALVRTEGASHMSFEGITFQHSRGTLIQLHGGKDLRVVGCTMRNAGMKGLVGNGADFLVYGCDVYETGEGGIHLQGGDRKRLLRGNHVIENNHVHHYSRRVRTYRTGITVTGCGNRIAHNLIHHGPHMALSAPGNNHLLEFNEIHNAVYESGDAGAYYVGRDWTQRGNVLQYNYWHHIKGSSTYGGMTIYLDDQHCGHTIRGNLFERCNQAVFIGGGDDNVVDNNVFLDCWKGAHLDNRGMGWQKKATDAPKGELRTKLKAMPYQNELWARTYPQLVNILQDDPGVPKRNVFTRNVSAGGKWHDINQSTIALQTVRDNLAFDDRPTWIKLNKDPNGKVLSIQYEDEQALERIGFQQLPVEKMGLYKDPRRASWPVVHPVDEVDIMSLDKLNAERSKRRQLRESTMPTLRIPRSDKDAVAAMISLNYRETGVKVNHPPQARIRHDGTHLVVSVDTPLSGKRILGRGWAAHEACELALMQSDGAIADILVLRGYTDCSFEGFTLFNERFKPLPNPQVIGFQATVCPDRWTCVWRVPLNLLHVSPGDRLRANVTVRRLSDSVFAMWRPTFGDSTQCDLVGFWELSAP